MKPKEVNRIAGLRRWSSPAAHKHDSGLIHGGMCGRRLRVGELEPAAGQTGIGPGPGGVHRVERQIQRHFFNPPQLHESKYRA
jgi:hypothetical protein